MKLNQFKRNSSIHEAIILEELDRDLYIGIQTLEDRKLCQTHFLFSMFTTFLIITLLNKLKTNDLGLKLKHKLKCFQVGFEQTYVLIFCIFYKPNLHTMKLNQFKRNSSIHEAIILEELERDLYIGIQTLEDRKLCQTHFLFSMFTTFLIITL